MGLCIPVLSFGLGISAISVRIDSGCWPEPLNPCCCPSVCSLAFAVAHLSRRGPHLFRSDARQYIAWRALPCLTHSRVPEVCPPLLARPPCASDCSSHSFHLRLRSDSVALSSRSAITAARRATACMAVTVHHMFHITNAPNVSCHSRALF
eukprot:4306522-Amphidinium_carterae.2